MSKLDSNQLVYSPDKLIMSLITECLKEANFERYKLVKKASERIKKKIKKK